jgi:hypothetical protein
LTVSLPRDVPRERERIQGVVLVSLVLFVETAWAAALVYLLLHFL